jgi:prepilin-type N-terminal cleavage/methylation domain-containing protein
MRSYLRGTASLPAMKLHPESPSPRRGFTLIELITVMAIIAILMSILIPCAAMVRETARRAKATTFTKAIVSSCKNYATDYGKYPPIPSALAQAGAGGASDDGGSYYSYGDTEMAKCKVANSQLFDVLRGIDRAPNKGHALNRRKQSYFEEAKATDPRSPRDGFVDGQEFPSEFQGQLLDPWGKQYCIILDADGDGLLKLTDFFKDLFEPVRTPAAAFAMAKNGAIGGKDYPGRLRKDPRSSDAPDDLISW